MSRSIGVNGSPIYRAVVTITTADGTTSTRHEGPYSAIAHARGRVTFWHRYLADTDHSTTGHVEQGHTTWTRVDEAGSNCTPAEEPA